MKNNPVSYFAKTNYRNDGRLFGIYQHDRLVGMHIVGKTGTGKTNLIKTLLLQDIYEGRGACILDIAGDLTTDIEKLIPENRKNDVMQLNLGDPNITLGYNPLRSVGKEYHHIITSHILEVFERIWGSNSWGTRIEYILRNSILTLLQIREVTFREIPKILTDTSYREYCVNHIEDESLRRFWLHEFPLYTNRDVLPVLNKIGSFLSIPLLKKILVDNQNQISFSNILNQSKILIVNMPKGVVGKDGAHMLGSLIIGSIATAGFNRVNIPEHDRKPFFVYLDEFQNFTSLTLVEMFSELRKFKIGFVLAHQYLEQMSDKIKDAVLGNIGTSICFRISYHDAHHYAKEMFPIFKASDFINLENHHIYLKLLINGKPSIPFSAVTVEYKKVIGR